MQNTGKNEANIQPYVDLTSLVNRGFNITWKKNFNLFSVGTPQVTASWER